MRIDELFSPSLENNRAPLYHATGFAAASNILENGKIKASDASEYREGHYHISTTRNPRLRYYGFDGDDRHGHAPFQFIINQQKVVTKHKITPFAFGLSDESEEKIHADEIPVDYITTMQVFDLPEEFKPNFDDEQFFKYIGGKKSAYENIIRQARANGLIVQDFRNKKVKSKKNIKEAEVNQLNEGMQFYAWKKTKTPDGEELFDIAFPEEWTRELNNDYMSPTFQDDEDIPNPNYKPELNLDMSQRNAQIVMSALGLSPSDEGFNMPIDQFINLARHWLKTHINKPSTGFGNTQNATDDELMIQAETEVAKVDTTFLKRKIENQVEKSFPDKSRDEKQKIITFRLGNEKKKMIDNLFTKKKEERGVKHYDFGLRDGYINEKILQMVMIAEKGKEVGAVEVGLS